MERYTYFDGGKWRLKIGDTEYSGDWVDRLAAYEDTGLKPEDMKRAFNEDAVLKLAGQALGMSPDRLRELAYFYINFFIIIYSTNCFFRKMGGLWYCHVCTVKKLRCFRYAKPPRPR